MASNYYQQILLNIKRSVQLQKKRVKEIESDSRVDVSNIEYDKHSAQTTAYKIMSHLNKTEKYTASINIMRRNLAKLL